MLSKKEEDYVLEQAREKHFEKKEVFLQGLTKKCEICNKRYFEEDIRKATIDEIPNSEVCVFCIEGMRLF